MGELVVVGAARLAGRVRVDGRSGQPGQHMDQPVLGVVLTLGPTGRVDLEWHAGGNPSWNVGIDSASSFGPASLSWSARPTATRALPSTPTLPGWPRHRGSRRIRTPSATCTGFGVPRGTTPDPVIMLHTTGDGGALTDTERFFANQPVDQVIQPRGGNSS